MHLTLIQPSVGRKPDGTPYPASWRMEPLGIAALSGLIYLSERLGATQRLAIGAIILASAGAALTIRPRKHA